MRISTWFSGGAIGAAVVVLLVAASACTDDQPAPGVSLQLAVAVSPVASEPNDILVRITAGLEGRDGWVGVSGLSPELEVSLHGDHDEATPSAEGEHGTHHHLFEIGTTGVYHTDAFAFHEAGTFDLRATVTIDGQTYTGHTEVTVEPQTRALTTADGAQELYRVAIGSHPAEIDTAMGPVEAELMFSITDAVTGAPMTGWAGDLVVMVQDRSGMLVDDASNDTMTMAPGGGGREDHGFVSLGVVEEATAGTYVATYRFAEHGHWDVSLFVDLNGNGRVDFGECVTFAAETE